MLIVHPLPRLSRLYATISSVIIPRMARMPRNRHSVIRGKVAAVTDSNKLDLGLDSLRRSQSHLYVATLRAGVAQAEEIVKALGDSEATMEQIKAVLREFQSGHLFADISEKKVHSKSTPGRELGIVKEHQEGRVSPKGHESRRDTVLKRIENILTANLEATKAFATELTPLVNEYINLSDQTTIEGQRQLCEYIRDLCHTNHLAVKCPKSGSPTAVFAAPRPERKSPLRVVFKRGNHETYSVSRLQQVELMPTISLAEGHLHHTTVAMFVDPKIQR
jgi:hypothetical protein